MRRHADGAHARWPRRPTHGGLPWSRPVCLTAGFNANSRSRRRPAPADPIRRRGALFTRPNSVRLRSWWVERRNRTYHEHCKLSIAELKSSLIRLCPTLALVLQFSGVLHKRAATFNAPMVDELKGFGIRVRPSGRRDYILKYRNKHGRQRKPSLGVHGAITADQARKKAQKWLAVVADGGDPSADKQSERQMPNIRDLSVLAFRKPSTNGNPVLRIAYKCFPLITQHYRNQIGGRDS